MGAHTPRSLACALAFGAALAFAPVVLAGDPQPDPQPAPKPPPKLATDADAVAAVAEFKEGFKAKGLKGEDRTSQRDFAMAKLATIQHPLVVDALAAVSRENDPMLRMLATIYLGDQTLLPGLAGKSVVAAWKRGAADDASVLSALQSVARLRYLGARDDIRVALKSQSFAVKKAAITTIVMTDDIRLVRELLALAGVQVPSQGSGAPNAGGPAAEAKPDAKNSGGSETTTEGYSWEGAEEFQEGVEPGSQEAAEMEKRVNEQVEKNRAEAEAAAKAKDAAKGGMGAGSGTTGGSTGGGAAAGAVGGGSGGTTAPGGKGGGRDKSELVPLVLGALIKLSGQRFSGPSHFKTWWSENAVAVGEKMKKLDEKEKLQKAEAAAQAK
jgi:hypothetical protein